MFMTSMITWWRTKLKKKKKLRWESNSRDRGGQPLKKKNDYISTRNLDDEDVDVANITSTASSLTNPSTNNATKANSTLTRALHLKRVRVINLCKAGKTFALTVKSNGPGADAFKTNLKTNAAVLYDMTGTSFDVDDSGRVSDANALKGTRASPTKYIIEHVFEFQILSQFLEAQDAATTVAKKKAASATPPQPGPPDNPAYSVRNNPQNAGFQAIVDLIDDPKNMGAPCPWRYLSHNAVDTTNNVLGRIANHKFGIAPLDQGFIAGSEYSDDFKNLNEPKAVAKREEVQQYLRGSGATGLGKNDASAAKCRIIDAALPHQGKN
ncbi:hypothetical protein C8R43DRAFT_943456 [Mycena crocata]|nr:hypothetical protein C8R43DRAFT_943456 [Mycena crocata]